MGPADAHPSCPLLRRAWPIPCTGSHIRCYPGLLPAASIPVLVPESPMAGSEASQPSPSPADCHGRTGSLLPCLHEVDAWLVSALFHANLSSTGPALPYRSSGGKDHSFWFGRTGWLRQPSHLTCPRTSAAVYSPIPQRLGGDGGTDRRTGHGTSHAPAPKLQVEDAAGAAGTLTIVALGTPISAGT